MFHPASLLLAWFGFALGLQSLPVNWLLLVGLICGLATAIFSAERGLSLMRRSRWLLLSLGLLYSFATPGEYLPAPWGEFGMTFEGLRQGGEQIGRLVTLLASLALLHRFVGTQGLLAGFYCLLKFMPWRDSTVVRLMLVFEFVDQKPQVGWREWLMPEGKADDIAGLPRYGLPMPTLQLKDKMLMAIVLALSLLVLIRP